MLPVSPELIDELTPSHCEAVVIGLCLAVVVGVVGGRVLIEALRGPAKLAAGRLTCALIGHRSALDDVPERDRPGGSFVGPCTRCWSRRTWTY